MKVAWLRMNARTVNFYVAGDKPARLKTTHTTSRAAAWMNYKL
jgi:hypothetical protein